MKFGVLALDFDGTSARDSALSRTKTSNLNGLPLSMAMLILERYSPSPHLAQ